MTEAAENAAPQPGPDFIWMSFEEHLYTLLTLADTDASLAEEKEIHTAILEAIKARLAVIEAAQAHLKYMIAGNAAAIVALIAFIYDSGGIARTSVVLKIITVVAAVALLASLLLTFLQFSRFTVQEQVQKWRIAIAQSKNWPLLIQLWREARSDPALRGSYSGQATAGLEILILVLWLVGLIAVIVAWTVSFVAIVPAVSP